MAGEARVPELGKGVRYGFRGVRGMDFPVAREGGYGVGVVEETIWGEKKGHRISGRICMVVNFSAKEVRGREDWEAALHIPFSHRCLRRDPSLPLSSASRLFMLSHLTGSLRR